MHPPILGTTLSTRALCWATRGMSRSFRPLPNRCTNVLLLPNTTWSRRKAVISETRAPVL